LVKNKNQAANPAGFRDLIMVAGGFNLLSVGGALPTTLYSLYQKRFHFSEITLTLIFAAYVVGTLTTLTFFGRLSDQIGRSRSVLIAAGLAFLSTLVFIVARDIPMLFIGRVFSGASVGLGAGALTAWLEELHAEAERSTLWAAGANILGLGLGPLMTGLLVSFAPLRFRLTYIVFLALLALVVWMARSVRETVKDPVRHAADISFRPRFGLPREKRGAFFPPAAATFCSYAMMGYYTALAPSLLAHSLHIESPAVAGAVIFEAFLIGALVIMALAFLSPVAALPSGCTA
jgi:MFS family permease